MLLVFEIDIHEKARAAKAESEYTRGNVPPTKFFSQCVFRLGFYRKPSRIVLECQARYTCAQSCEVQLSCEIVS